MACSSCQQRRARTRGTAPSAEAMVKPAAPRYEVSGKRFATLTAAQDYARRTGSVIRPL